MQLKEGDLQLSQNGLTDHEWSLTIVIELVNKSVNKIEKTLIFTFGEDIQSNNYDQFQRDIKCHLGKTKTILRNIHPTFKILLGSFKVHPNSDNVGTDGSKIIFKDFTK